MFMLMFQINVRVMLGDDRGFYEVDAPKCHGNAQFERFWTNY